MFDEFATGTARDIRRLTLLSSGRGGKGAPPPQPEVQTLLETRFDERNGIVSPDGRWLAYESDASGQLQVYVRPFPNVGDGQWQISTRGGGQPLWARGGGELFYIGLDGALMAVKIEPRGASWNAGTPARLFDVRTNYAAMGIVIRMYDVSPDGQRFLVIKQGTGQTSTPPQIVVVQNWLEELKRLVPTN